MEGDCFIWKMTWKMRLSRSCTWPILFWSWFYNAFFQILCQTENFRCHGSKRIKKRICHMHEEITKKTIFFWIRIKSKTDPVMTSSFTGFSDKTVTLPYDLLLLSSSFINFLHHQWIFALWRLLKIFKRNPISFFYQLHSVITKNKKNNSSSPRWNFSTPFHWFPALLLLRVRRFLHEHLYNDL